MSSLDCIKNILNLKDPNIYFKHNYYSEEIINNIESKVFTGFLSYEPAACSSCGCTFDNQIIKHGFKASLIKLPQVSGFNSYLRLKKQRYYCKHCSSTFSLSSSVVQKNCFISNNTKLSVALALKNKISEKDIAKNHNVSHATVNRVLDHGFCNYSPQFNYLPHNLCFDEFKSTKSADGAMSFIFCNAENGQILDIVENRRLSKLMQYFYRYSKKARSSVKRIVIDMYSPYISLIKKLFPKAKIVIDKFHIVQLFHRSLNKTRIQVMNQHKSHYNKFKKYWKLLLKKDSKLNVYDYYYRKSFKKPMREVDIVNFLLEQNPSLKASYQLYQDLLYCCDTKDFERLSLIIKHPNALLSTYMKTCIKTIKKYFPYINNTFSCSYTNGIIEGINNKIKVIKRIAFGYRSFLHLKNRILISKDMLKLKAT